MLITIIVVAFFFYMLGYGCANAKAQRRDLERISQEINNFTPYSSHNMEL